MQSGRSKPCRPGINRALSFSPCLLESFESVCLLLLCPDPTPCSVHVCGCGPLLAPAIHSDHSKLLLDTLHPLASTTRFRVHAAHTCSHTCVLKHWQQRLGNCFGLCFFFCVFIWRLKHIAYIKLPWRHGQTNLVCCIRARSSNIPICADKLPLHVALFDELYAYRRNRMFFFFLKHDLSCSVKL